MHWQSFYVKPDMVYGNELVFLEDEAHHLSRVMRKRKGDIVWAVDGKGTTYEVEIIYIEKNEVRAKILKTRRRVGEPVAEVTLAQGILKGEKFDWLVEKAVEIGVCKIIPVISERSIAVAGPQKITRWKRIALSAMKQSGRSILPEISSAQPIKRVLAMGSNCHYRLIAHQGPGSASLRTSREKRSVLNPKSLLIIGPEGGFTSEEIQQAVEQGFTPITLGPRRLRAETAGIVLTALLLSQLGEME